MNNGSSGIKEDVLEMILNFKQLRLKMFTDEDVRLSLKVKGKKWLPQATSLRTVKLKLLIRI